MGGVEGDNQHSPHLGGGGYFKQRTVRVYAAVPDQIVKHLAGAVYGQLITLGEDGKTLDVVGMLMGDQDAVEGLRGEAELCQRPDNRLAADACIHQHCPALAGDKGAVAAAAAE